MKVRFYYQTIKVTVIVLFLMLSIACVIRARENAPHRRKAGWYKGDLHLHSNHSDGKVSVAEIVAAAEKAGLDFIAITEHTNKNVRQWNDPAYRSRRMTLLYGAEWTVNRYIDHRNVVAITAPVFVASGKAPGQSEK